MISALGCLLLQTQPAAAPEPATYWGLKAGEWITIAAILIGPIAAVLTQLWIQKYRELKNQKLWVYGALISYRATWIAPDFVRAMNYVDVVFYQSKSIRAKRAELLTHLKKTTTADGTVQQVDWDKAADLCAELLDLMGKTLGYDFSHTQIKDSAYYPVGHERLDRTAIELREKGLAVLEGTAPIRVVVDQPVAPAHAPRLAR